ncbi:hypothetical protein V2E39_20955 [Chryseobacterium arthrosphaerae]|uniref:Uncharacterized protein n=1 Tax=Chryseobacterium arthrosphaerae TaxID=651561 RepID=A0ABU7R575_9FLAO|nr:hypothetical protein [Chryseobacterium arthrosphaerae]
MTKNFTETEWQQIGGGLKLEINFQSTESDRPIVQVYRIDSGTSMLISPNVILTNEFITLIIMADAFNGYVVIK